MAATAATRWKLGLFVVVSLGLALGSLLWLGETRFWRNTVPIVTYFDESVQGLDIGSPIKFRGAPIGTVSRITIAPDRRHIEVESQIFTENLVRLGIVERGALAGASLGIPPDLRAQLTPAGITTGLTFVQIDVFDPERYPPPPLPFPTPPNYVPAVPSVLKDIQEAVMISLAELPEIERTLERALGETDQTLAEVRGLARSLGAKDGPLLGLLGRLDTLAGTLDRGILASRPGETAASFREAADALADTARKVGAASQDVNRASQRVGLATDQVRLEVRGVADDLREALDSFRESADAVRALADYLERDPRSLLRGRRPESTGPPGGVRDVGRR